ARRQLADDAERDRHGDHLAEAGGSVDRVGAHARTKIAGELLELSRISARADLDLVPSGGEQGGERRADAPAADDADLHCPWRRCHPAQYAAGVAVARYRMRLEPDRVGVADRSRPTPRAKPASAPAGAARGRAGGRRTPGARAASWPAPPDARWRAARHRPRARRGPVRGR